MNRQMCPIPALRINNRKRNQEFLEEDLGLKTRLEEGAFVEFSGHKTPQTQLILIESPSMRTRAVKGPKKLAKLVFKVTEPSEIASLLARGSRYSRLFQGKKGYAFEALSPEGDLFLLHAEETVADLVPIEQLGCVEVAPDFTGLTQFELEMIVLRTDRVAEMAHFYRTLFPHLGLLQFEEGQGPDLQATAESTWDIDSLRFTVDGEWTTFEKHLPAGYFKDKKGRFIQTTDPSQIEIWLEK